MKGIPRHERVRKAISTKLKGVPKTPETRAAMAASKMFNRSTHPEQWAAVYDEKLTAIRAAETIKRIRAAEGE